MTIEAKEKFKSRIMADIETIFEEPEIFEDLLPAPLYKARAAFDDIRNIACTLRIQQVIRDAMKQNPDLDLGERINLNGFSLVAIQGADGSVQVTVDGSGRVAAEGEQDKDIPF